MLTALNPLELLTSMRLLTRSMIRNRALLMEMVRRDWVDPFAGQVFGAVWLIVHPALIVGVYVFLFNVIFKVQLPADGGYKYDYTVYLLSGLVPWIAMAQAMGRSATTLTGHSNLVKQVVFPVEILPVKVAIASVITGFVGVAIILWYTCLRFGMPPATYLLLPLLLVMLVGFVAGLNMIVSTIGVFVRDMKDFMQMIVIVGVYFIPAVYMPGWAPEAFQTFLNLNPLSHIIWTFQDALFFGEIRHPTSWVVFGLMATLLPFIGYTFFRRLRPNFADFL